MELNLISGRAGTGKSLFCINEMKKFEKSILIVPEQFSFSAEKNLTRAVGAAGFGGAETLSFRRLAYKVLSETGRLWQPLDPCGKSMALYVIMEEIADKLVIFKNSQEKPGFTSEAVKTISEFKRYNITPEQLQKTAENINSPLLSGKMRDMAIIYSAFCEFLGADYTDSDDELNFLASAIPSSKILSGSHIFIDQFTTFTPQEYAVIKELLYCCESVSITLCDDEDSDTAQFYSAKNTALKLKKLSNEIGCSVFYKSFDVPLKFSNPELKHLESQFFNLPFSVFSDKTDNINLFTAKNPYSEIEFVARTIIALCRDKGYKYKDISVIAKDLAPYERIINECFSKHGIPCFTDTKTSIGNHSISLFLQAALDVVNKGWSYEAVFNCLKSGYMPIDKNDTDLLEKYVLATGIRGNTWTSDEKWNYTFGVFSEKNNELDEKSLNRLDEIRRQIATPLFSLHERIKGRHTAREHSQALYLFMDEIGLEKTLNAKIEALKDMGEMDLALLYTQVYNSVITALDSLSGALGEKKLNPRRFATALFCGLSSLEISIIPSSVDSVSAGSVMRARGNSAKAVFLIGATDGFFPSLQSGGSLLNDADRRALNELGLELAPDSTMQSFEEQALIYSAITMPHESLFVTNSAADMDGRAMRPSIIVTNIKAMFPNITQSDDLLPLSAMQLISTPSAVFTPLVSALRAEKDGVSIDDLWHEVYAWFLSNDFWKDKIKSSIESFSYKNTAETLTKAQADKCFNTSVMSVSRLENYKNCPFSYFMNYILKAQPNKEKPQMSAMDTGSFLHRVIDIFSHNLENEGLSWREIDKAYITKGVDEAVNSLYSAINKYVLKDSKRYAYLFIRLKRLAVRAVSIIQLHIARGKFEPLGYEISFDSKGKFKPLTVKLLNGAELKLSGKIDRVDALETENGSFLRVVDYKSGNKDFALSDVYSGMSLQLCVYLTALCEQTNAKPAGILYFKLDDPVIDSTPEMGDDYIEGEILKKLKMRGLILSDDKIITAMDSQIAGFSDILPVSVNKNGIGSTSSVATMEQFDYLSKHIKKTVASLASRMSEGDVGIYPAKTGDAKSCDFCPFSAACAFDTTCGCSYNEIMQFSKEEVWEKLKVEEV